MGQSHISLNMDKSLALTIIGFALVSARPDGPGAHHQGQHGGHHAVHHEVQPTVHLGSSDHTTVPLGSHSVHNVGSQSGQTVAQLVSTHPKLTTLLSAVSEAGLVDTLNGEGPFTVFAPTNIAFDKIPVDALNALLQKPEDLKNVLLRHVVPAKIQGKNIPPGSTDLKAANGDTLTATRDKFIQVKSGEGSAYIVLFDIIASNGVIHAIDTVI